MEPDRCPHGFLKPVACPMCDPEYYKLSEEQEARLRERVRAVHLKSE